MKWRKFKPNNNERSQQVRSLVSRHIYQLAIEADCIDLLNCRLQLQCLASLECQISMITLMSPICPLHLSIIMIERVKLQWANRIVPTVFQNKTLNRTPLVNRKLCNFWQLYRKSHTYTSCIRCWSCFRFNGCCTYEFFTLMMSPSDPYTTPP